MTGNACPRADSPPYEMLNAVRTNAIISLNLTGLILAFIPWWALRYKWHLAFFYPPATSSNIRISHLRGTTIDSVISVGLTNWISATLTQNGLQRHPLKRGFDTFRAAIFSHHPAPFTLKFLLIFRKCLQISIFAPWYRSLLLMLCDECESVSSRRSAECKQPLAGRDFRESGFQFGSGLQKTGAFPRRAFGPDSCPPAALTPPAPPNFLLPKATTSTNFMSGDMQYTGNKNDVAIEGKGFFQVQLPNGTMPSPATANSRSTPRASS